MELEKLRKDFSDFFSLFKKAVTVIEEEFYPHVDRTDFTFDSYNQANNTVEIEFTTYSPGAGYSDDDEYLVVPDTVITEKGLNEFLNELREKKRQRIEGAQQAARKREEKQKEEQEEKDREKYEELKKKFEQTPEG